MLKLGFTASQRTVGQYIVGPPQSGRSQTWKSFLHNHLSQMVSMDFFTLPTLTFGLLYVCIVLDHHRRKVLRFQITKAPSAIWAAQQLREAFAFTSPPESPLRDRDGQMIGSFGLVQVLDGSEPLAEGAPLLSLRERETLTLLAAGFSTEEMAQQMGISMETVRNHVKHVLRILDARSRLEAVAKARDCGLI